MLVQPRLQQPGSSRPLKMTENQIDLHTLRCARIKLGAPARAARSGFLLDLKWSLLKDTFARRLVFRSLSHPRHDLVCLRNLCGMACLQPHAQAWAHRPSTMPEDNVPNVMSITKATTLQSPTPPHRRHWPRKGRTNNNARRGILWRKQSLLHTPAGASQLVHTPLQHTDPPSSPHVCVPLAQSTLSSKK